MGQQRRRSALGRGGDPGTGGRREGSRRTETSADAGSTNSEASRGDGAGSTTPLLDAAGSEHVIQRGDTLTSIARHYGVTIEAIASENGIADPNRIRVGQTLRIPTSSSNGSGDRDAGAIPRTYVVMRGDTLTAISERFGVSIEALAQQNRIRDVNTIQVGQVLQLQTTAPERVPIPRPKPTVRVTTDSKPEPQQTMPEPNNQQDDAQQSGGSSMTPALQAATDAVLAVVPRDQVRYARTEVPDILRSCQTHAVRSADQVAYLLATAEHESRFGKPLYSRSQSMMEDHNPYTVQADGTWSARVHTSGRTVTANSEAELDVKYWDDAYGGRLDNAKGTEDAANFRGRGLVQLTGRTNYEDMTERLADSGFQYTLDGVTYGGPGQAPIDLVANPDHVNRSTSLAAEILVVGATEGSFTGRALGASINEQGSDFYNARAVINGDKAKNGQAIAQTAERYGRALRPVWSEAFVQA